jgi:hypothetical protein
LNQNCSSRAAEMSVRGPAARGDPGECSAARGAAPCRSPSRDARCEHVSVARRRLVSTRTVLVGAFGTVKAGVHAPTGAGVAVKVMEESAIQAGDTSLNVRREVAIVKALKHQTAVGLRAVCSRRLLAGVSSCRARGSVRRASFRHLTRMCVARLRRPESESSLLNDLDGPEARSGWAQRLMCREGAHAAVSTANQRRTWTFPLPTVVALRYCRRVTWPAEPPLPRYRRMLCCFWGSHHPPAPLPPCGRPGMRALPLARRHRRPRPRATHQ